MLGQGGTEAIADMDLDPDSLSQGEEALISASSSKTSCASALYLRIAMGIGFKKLIQYRLIVSVF